jgi:hypothetical protein
MVKTHDFSIHRIHALGIFSLRIYIFIYLIYRFPSTTMLNNEIFNFRINFRLTVLHILLCLVFLIYVLGYLLKDFEMLKIYVIPLISIIVSLRIIVFLQYCIQVLYSKGFRLQKILGGIYIYAIFHEATYCQLYSRLRDQPFKINNSTSQQQQMYNRTYNVDSTSFDIFNSSSLLYGLHQNHSIQEGVNYCFADYVKAFEYQSIHLCRNKTPDIDGPKENENDQLYSSSNFGFYSSWKYPLYHQSIDYYCYVYEDISPVDKDIQVNRSSQLFSTISDSRKNMTPFELQESALAPKEKQFALDEVYISDQLKENEFCSAPDFILGESDTVIVPTPSLIELQSTLGREEINYESSKLDLTSLIQLQSTLGREEINHERSTMDTTSLIQLQNTLGRAQINYESSNISKTENKTIEITQDKLDSRTLQPHNGAAKVILGRDIVLIALCIYTFLVNKL